MSEYKLRRGYDIPLLGAASAEIGDAARPASVALRPCDFLGVKFRLLVREGDKVKIGSPLLQSKTHEDMLFTSPAGGTVKAIIRGHRRALMSIVIEPDEQEEAETFPSWDAGKLASLSRDESLKQLLKSGLLSAFRERPFNYVANPDHCPRDIFISTFDTAPLAADKNVIVEGEEKYFQAGLDVCSTLTTGQVHLSLNGKGTPSAAFSSAKNVQTHRFSGAHPAGNVGVQIHHVKPIAGREDVVWHISVQGLITVGKLFLDGKLDPTITVAVAGSAATKRQYYRTRIGAQIDSIVHGNVQPGDLRYITGNVLTGTQVSPDGHIGFYSDLVTVIPETTDPEFIGWMLPGASKPSWFRGFLANLFVGKKFEQDTCINGGHRAFVMNDIYEDVLPMDVLPVYLIKSCLYQDIEEMEQLGIYEVCEDEVALCEYICPSKTEFQKILREGLNLIEKEG